MKQYMNSALLNMTIFLVKLCLRRNGWTNEPRPDGFKADSRYDFWRRLGPSKIQSADIGLALNSVIKKQIP